MPNATFVLKDSKAESETLVYLIMRYNNSRLKYSTGQKIHPNHWNTKTRRVRATKYYEDHETFNSLLDAMQQEAEHAYKDILKEGIEPTPERIKTYLDRKFPQKTKTKAATSESISSFFNFIEHFIKTSNRNKNTIKQYTLTKNNLLAFQKESKRALTFEAIDNSFYDNFVRFLVSKNYAPNTIGGRIKNLKVFMNEAVERGITKNIQFRNKRFIKPSEKSESIYLTLDEINAIYKLDLSDNERLDKVRDLFIIGCYTGLRFSDLSQLTPQNISEDGTKLKVRTKKTDTIVIIPLHKNVKEILNKYNGVPPQMISNQKMNEYLKELGAEAELKEEIAITTIRGDKKETEVFFKYQLITAHTARRSFATNAYLSDVPTISIMKITGHSTEKAFLSYIKMSQEENANKLLNHPFFNS